MCVCFFTGSRKVFTPLHLFYILYMCYNLIFYMVDWHKVHIIMRTEMWNALACICDQPPLVCIPLVKQCNQLSTDVTYLELLLRIFLFIFLSRENSPGSEILYLFVFLLCPLKPKVSLTSSLVLLCFMLKGSFFYTLLLLYACYMWWISTKSTTKCKLEEFPEYIFLYVENIATINLDDLIELSL